jgi:hypothetical protein
MGSASIGIPVVNASALLADALSKFEDFWAMALNMESLFRAMQNCESQLQPLVAASQRQQAQLQQVATQVQSLSWQFQSLCNLWKAKHDTAKNAIILAATAVPIVSGGSTLNSAISGTGKLAAPLVPGGSILNAAITSAKESK